MASEKKPSYNNLEHQAAFRLWNMIITSIKLLVFLVVLALIYFPLKPTINDYLNQPRYNEESLEAYTKKRSRIVNQDSDLVENGIHLKSGLAYDKDTKVIIATCTTCHSAKLITQNRASREGWKYMIVWMQETQGLPDLGDRETIVLDYLAKHYKPEAVGRRPNLDMASVEWYILELKNDN